MNGPCPSIPEWNELLDGALAPDHEERLLRHLESCRSCEAAATPLFEVDALAALAFDDTPVAAPPWNPRRPLLVAAAALLLIVGLFVIDGEKAAKTQSRAEQPSDQAPRTNTCRVLWMRVEETREAEGVLHCSRLEIDSLGRRSSATTLFQKPGTAQWTLRESQDTEGDR